MPEEQEEDHQDVCRDHLRVRSVLAPLPRLLHLLLPPADHHGPPLHQARLPWLLLAGHGQLCCQPHHLLLDGKQIPEIFQSAALVQLSEGQGFIFTIYARFYFSFGKKTGNLKIK